MQIPFESVAGLRSDPSAFQLPKASATEQTGSVPFSQVFRDAIGNVNESQNLATQTVDRMLAGENVGIQEVSLQIAQADLSFRFLMEVRDRSITAYQEVMRTQM